MKYDKATAEACVVEFLGYLADSDRIDQYGRTPSETGELVKARTGCIERMRKLCEPALSSERPDDPEGEIEAVRCARSARRTGTICKRRGCSYSATYPDGHCFQCHRTAILAARVKRKRERDEETT